VLARSDLDGELEVDDCLRTTHSVHYSVAEDAKVLTPLRHSCGAARSFKMESLKANWKVPVRMTVRTGRRIMRTLFFDRVIRRMKRTGPVEDLDELVKLASGG
jgi:hypothetical protein